VDAILQDKQGTFWFGAGGGLYKSTGAQITAYTTADGLPDSGINALMEDRQGRLWIGTRAGAARLEGGRFVAIRKADGLAGDRVRSIHEDRDGAIWIGTFDSGISRYKDGRWTTYTTRTGLFSDGAFQILEDARDNFWISSNRGIYRVSRRQMNDVAEGRATTVTSVAYGTQDGMLSAECNGGRQPAGVKGRDGRLWFPTQNGIVAIDPKAVVDNTQPPVVVIDAATVDGAAVNVDSGIRLAPGQSDLEIRYTAPSSVKAEHMQFRYMLEGLNTHWIEAGTRREVHYSELGPGRYTFKLFASNSDGVWSRLPLSMPVYVAPFFYQTGWFIGLCILAVMAAATAGYRLRLRRLKANERRLGQLVAERTSELNELTQHLNIANSLLAELATVDSLTELANRRRFDSYLTQESQRATRTRAPLSLLLLDVDEFKHFNDTYGHQQGDECLRQIAAMLRITVRRASDLVARFGGEEIAVVLPETPAAGADVVAESIRLALARLAIPHEGSSVSDVVTVSIGMATREPDQDDTPADLIAACDAALYRAKAAGRNRVSR
jgi:diguanylate cyclase (GGDEF)-like protein